MADRLQVNNGAIFRIPKPWGMGMLFGSGVERTLEAFQAHNPEALRHWGNSIAECAIPQIHPDRQAAPIINQWTIGTPSRIGHLIPDQLEK